MEPAGAHTLAALPVRSSRTLKPQAFLPPVPEVLTLCCAQTQDTSFMFNPSVSLPHSGPSSDKRQSGT